MHYCQGNCHFWEFATTQYTTVLFQSCDRKQKGRKTCLCTLPLTSSLVVWLREIRYVWKPVSPTTDQSVKKHTSTSTTVERTVKETSCRNTNIYYYLGCSSWSKLLTNDSCTLHYIVCTVYSTDITVLQIAINRAYQCVFHFIQHSAISLDSKITTDHLQA